MNLLLSVRNLKIFALCIFFVISFRLINPIPGLEVVKVLWLIINVFFLVLVYPFLVRRRGFKLLPFELYAVSIIVVTPILSALASWDTFGQPLIYGVLTQRNTILSASAIIILYLLRSGSVRLWYIEKALVILAWGTLGVYLLVGIFVDPAQFAATQFVGGENVGQPEFKFNSVFIIIGFLYYFHMSLQHGDRNRLYVFASIIFFSYLLIEDGRRAMLMALMVAVMVSSLNRQTYSKLLANAPMFLLILLSAIVGSLVFYEERLVGFVQYFGDALVVAFLGQESNDISANIRIAQTMTVWPYIESSWLFGNGDISNQWNGGYDVALRGYFYPSDIGLIGAMYLYGVFGITLFAGQFYFAYKSSRLMRRGSSVFENAVKSFVLYYAIHSISNGQFIHLVEVGFVMSAILVFMAISRRHIL